jgi:transcriptional regulator with XRE-family HTH domain
MSARSRQKETRYEKLGKALGRALGQRPQWWLAQETFVTQVAVSQWICGVSRPRPEKLGQLAALLKLGVDELTNLAGYDDNLYALDMIRAAYQHWCQIYH